MFCRPNIIFQLYQIKEQKRHFHANSENKSTPPNGFKKKKKKKKNPHHLIQL